MSPPAAPPSRHLHSTTHWRCTPHRHRSGDTQQRSGGTAHDRTPPLHTATHVSPASSARHSACGPSASSLLPCCCGAGGDALPWRSGASMKYLRVSVDAGRQQRSINGAPSPRTPHSLTHSLTHTQHNINKRRTGSRSWRAAGVRDSPVAPHAPPPAHRHTAAGPRHRPCRRGRAAPWCWA